MTVAGIGLVLDMVGVLLIGIVLPRHQQVAYGGKRIVLSPAGKWLWPIAWLALMVGFGLQLYGLPL